MLKMYSSISNHVCESEAAGVSKKIEDDRNKIILH